MTPADSKVMPHVHNSQANTMQQEKEEGLVKCLSSWYKRNAIRQNAVVVSLCNSTVSHASQMHICGGSQILTALYEHGICIWPDPPPFPVRVSHARLINCSLPALWLCSILLVPRHRSVPSLTLWVAAISSIMTPEENAFLMVALVAAYSIFSFTCEWETVNTTERIDNTHHAMCTSITNMHAINIDTNGEKTLWCSSIVWLLSTYM